MTLTKELLAEFEEKWYSLDGFMTRVSDEAKDIELVKAFLEQSISKAVKAERVRISDKISNLAGWQESPEYDRALDDLRVKLLKETP